MKTRKLLRMLAIIAGLLCASHLMALDHGSMKGTGLPMYPIRDGKVPGAVVAGITFDFKLVTIGSKTWAWTDWHGKNIAGNTWSSQLRYWMPEILENNLLGRVSGTQQTYGTAGLPITTSSTITFLQEENNAFFETEDLTYDYTKPNSKDDADNEAPVLNEPVTNQTALSLELTLSATDNSGDYFYYVIDEANGFTEVSFSNNVSLALAPKTAHTFSIYAIDFSGNMSEAKIVNTDAQEAVYFTEGTAQAISFKLDSRSLTELVIECTSSELIGDAFVKLELNGTAVSGEWKPTIAASGANTYKITVPASAVPGWAEGEILSLNVGYIIMPIGDWGHYVTENKTITSGANAGMPILHKIGTGVDIDDPEPPTQYECENNLFSDTEFSVGEIFFATTWDWIPSTNYTATIQNSNEFHVNLGDETVVEWQAQFRMIPTTPVPVTPGVKYGITLNVETTKSLPVYVKLMDNNDDFYLDIARTTVVAPGKVLEAYNFECPVGLTQISQILFDFGGSAADTDIKISDVVLCDQLGETTGLAELSANEISVYQTRDMLIINSANQVQSFALFSINGQSLPVKSTGNTVDISGLAKGIYILKVEDSTANLKVCKIAVK